ncbi:MAG: HNH endonuclease family protein, partial [Kocuria sp.]|nr:HNH endonuclease family protein [Kocuria sp.]
MKSRGRIVRGSVWSVVVALALVVPACLGLLIGPDGEWPGKRIRTWIQGGAGHVILSEESAGYLAALSVKNQGAQDAYDRESFGRAWSDEDRNGCDTRNDILARDLARATFRDRGLCVVAKGTLEDPYTGQSIEFVAGKESRKVQIDHVVALSNAWASGASEWTDEKRRTFANDPDNLLAVDGRANQDKGGSDASRWLPPRREFHCSYVMRQLKIKARYSLSVTPEEKEAILKVLGECPEYRLSAFVLTEHDHALSRKVLDPAVRPASYEAQRHRRNIPAQRMHGKLVRVQTSDHVGVRRDDAEPRMFPQQQQHSAQIRVREG